MEPSEIQLKNRPSQDIGVCGLPIASQKLREYIVAKHPFRQGIDIVKIKLFLLEMDALTRFDRLLQINEDAFAECDYTTAYHVLAAALSCAKSNRSAEQISMVGLIAMAQSEFIDHNAPYYAHSSASTIGLESHRKGLFFVLAEMAHTERVLLQ